MPEAINMFEILAYLDANSYEGVSLATVAKHFGVDKKILKEQIKKQKNSKKYLKILDIGKYKDAAEWKLKKAPLIVPFLEANKTRGVIMQEIMEVTEGTKYLIENYLKSLENSKNYFAIIRDARSWKPPCPYKIPAENNVTAENNHDTTEVNDNFIEAPSTLKTLSAFSRNARQIKVIMDSSIFDMSYAEFISTIKYFAQNNMNASLFFFEEQLVFLLENDSSISRDIFNYIEQNPNNIIRDKKPEFGMYFAEYCKNNGYSLLSGHAKNVAWARYYGVTVTIPYKYLNEYPNPCKGNDIVAVDTELLNGNIEQYVTTAKQFWVTNNQLVKLAFEKPRNSAIVAYYANFGTAEASKNVGYTNMGFWKEKVDKVITSDVKNSLIAKLLGIPCELYETNKKNKPNYDNTIFKALSSKIEHGEKFCLDIFVEKKGEKTFVKKTPTIVVKNHAGCIKGTVDGCYEVKVKDIIEVTLLNRHERIVGEVSSICENSVIIKIQ